jgi:hypothetical protein
MPSVNSRISTPGSIGSSVTEGFVQRYLPIGPDNAGIDWITPPDRTSNGDSALRVMTIVFVFKSIESRSSVADTWPWRKAKR